MSTPPKVDAAQTVIPTRTFVWLAPVGTAAPADATIALGTAWRSVGYTSEDSLKFNETPDIQTLKSGQSDFPIRYFQVGDAATIEVDLEQWSAANFQAVYGGGEITEIVVTGPPTATHYKFTPPRVGGRTEVAALIEVFDGGKHYRFMVPRCMQMDGVASDMSKGAASKLPLRLGVLGDDDTDPWYLITDDPAFADS
jgi:hypothetical protein